MPFELSWYDAEQTIVHIRIDGQIAAWQENNDAFVKAWHMVKSVQHPAYVIAHATPTGRMPPGNPLPHITNNLSIAPNNLEMLITIVASPFERTIMDIVKAANKHHRFYDRMFAAATLPQALDMVERHQRKTRSNHQT